MCIYVPEDEHPHAAPQLRPPPADERRPHQLPVTLLGHSSIQTTLIYLELVPDGPNGEPCDGAVTCP